MTRVIIVVLALACIQLVSAWYHERKMRRFAERSRDRAIDAVLIRDGVITRGEGCRRELARMGRAP